MLCQICKTEKKVSTIVVMSKRLPDLVEPIVSVCITCQKKVENKIMEMVI